jgi:hypothetical protein
MATSWPVTALGWSNCRRKWPHKSLMATRGRYSRISGRRRGVHAAAPIGRARLIRSRSRGVHRLPQVAASLYVQPEVRAVTEHTGKNERSRRGNGPAVIAKLGDVLAWNAHGLGQHALSQSHRLHEFLNRDFAHASRFPFRHQHRSPRVGQVVGKAKRAHQSVAVLVH